MVDSQKGDVMADRIDDLTGRVGRVEQNLEQLSQTVEQLSQTVERGFEEVSVAFDEQRRYTDSAFEHFERRMNEHFALRMNAMFEGMDARFDRLENKLDQFIEVQGRANILVERRLQSLEQRSDRSGQ